MTADPKLQPFNFLLGRTMHADAQGLCFWGYTVDLLPSVTPCLFFALNNNLHTHNGVWLCVCACVYVHCGEEEEGLKSMTDDSGERGSLCLLTPINYQSVRPTQFACVCVLTVCVCGLCGSVWV